MKRRPLAILLIGGALILSPVYYYFEKAFLARIPWTDAVAIFAAMSAQKLVGVVLAPIVGALVLLVRPVSWYAIVAYAAYTVAVNASLVALGQMRAWAFFANVATASIVLLYFVRREVTSPYFNPRLRWWESDRVRCRVPVALEIDGREPIEAETVDVSGTGAFVATDADVDPGVELRCTLRFEAGPIATAATVVRVAERGLGLRFDPAVASEVRGALRAITKRSEERVPFELEVEIVGRDPIRCRTFDLSAGGCFLVTERTFAPGEGLAMTLHLIDGPVQVDGMVVWTSDGSRMPRGVGIRFRRRSREIAAQLRDMHARTERAPQDVAREASA